MRYQGCLVGLAVGDAIGTTVEFKSPGTFSPLTDMVGGGPFGLEKGQWTDDTSMALCLADSLITCETFDANDQMARYTRWWKEGYLSSNGRCFDIGNTVSQALRKYARTGDPFAGATDVYSAGNGSLMRLAPVPLFYASDPEKAIAMSAESSKTTHGAITCLDACRFFGGLLVGAVRGDSKEALLSCRYAPADGVWDRMPLCAEIDEIACGSYQRKNPPDIVGSGYVVQSLEAALWAFHQSSTFEEGCLLATNLGNDADTTAAIYGQITGAYYGIEGIRSDWRECLAQIDLIHRLADGLFHQNSECQSEYSRMQ
jgi:ADP-ribosylglycohydrolase